MNRDRSITIAASEVPKIEAARSGVLKEPVPKLKQMVLEGRNVRRSELIVASEHRIAQLAERSFVRQLGNFAKELGCKRRVDISAMNEDVSQRMVIRLSIGHSGSHDKIRSALSTPADLILKWMDENVEAQTEEK